MDDQEKPTTIIIVLIAMLVGFVPAGAAFATYFTAPYWRQERPPIVDRMTTNSVLKDRHRITAPMTHWYQAGPQGSD